MEIYLASRSPRRAELLEQIGLEYIVRPSRIREEAIVGDWLRPRLSAERLALAKARDIAEGLATGLVIAADTIVVGGGKVLGKPRTVAEAVAMLELLNGRTHEVITGLAVVQAPAGRQEVASEVTEVTFRHLTASEIAAYVASGEPMDKAGGYGIQGLGALLVARIEGCYFNVVGLPLVRLAGMLEHFGVVLLK